MNWRRAADRIAADAHGRRGEEEAARWLAAQGFALLARRVKTPRGEVDLIARGEGLVVFVEVKWRARAGDLAQAIDQRRLARVAAAAEVLAPHYVKPGEDMRIDVLLLAPGHDPHHIANAWMPL
ncbi:MAG TPA: YraN family protein [Novosphingobium sp.]|nr:YraN family protein [Novosphingobium sp.]